MRIISFIHSLRSPCHLVGFFGKPYSLQSHQPHTAVRRTASVSVCLSVCGRPRGCVCVCVRECVCACVWECVRICLSVLVLIVCASLLAVDCVCVIVGGRRVAFSGQPTLRSARRRSERTAHSGTKTARAMCGCDLEDTTLPTCLLIRFDAGIYRDRLMHTRTLTRTHTCTHARMHARTHVRTQERKSCG